MQQRPFDSRAWKTVKSIATPCWMVLHNSRMHKLRFETVHRRCMAARGDSAESTFIALNLARLQLTGSDAAEVALQYL
jgi:hypothetical protein